MIEYKCDFSIKKQNLNGTPLVVEWRMCFSSVWFYFLERRRQ